MKRFKKFLNIKHLFYFVNFFRKKTSRKARSHNDWRRSIKAEKVPKKIKTSVQQEVFSRFLCQMLREVPYKSPVRRDEGVRKTGTKGIKRFIDEPSKPNRVATYGWRVFFRYYQFLFIVGSKWEIRVFLFLIFLTRFFIPFSSLCPID